MQVVDVRRGANAEGRLNAWAHVQFETVAEANAAAEQLSGTELMGRELFVESAAAQVTGLTSLQGCCWVFHIWFW